jgi:hypothetical protein
MDGSSFGETQANEGKLRVLWVAPYAQPLALKNGVRAFSLSFKVLRPIEDWATVISLDDKVLRGSAFETDGTAHSFNMDFTEGGIAITETPALAEQLDVTVVPNPFSDKLRFFMSLPKDGASFEITVFDSHGRKVAFREGSAGPQAKEVVFDRTQDWGNGIFTYQVKSGNGIVSGKISRLK